VLVGDTVVVPKSVPFKPSPLLAAVVPAIVPINLVFAVLNVVKFAVYVVADDDGNVNDWLWNSAA
jgi:hypothetical protein